MNDNTATIVKKAVHYFNIPVSSTTIEETIIPHPDYPSLKSICDALDEWNINNYALRLRQEELEQYKVPFIAHLNSQEEKFVFIPEYISGKNLKYIDELGSARSMSVDQFSKEYSGVILILDPDETSGEDGFKEKKQNENLRSYMIGLGIFTILWIASFLVFHAQGNYSLDVTWLALLVTKSIGIILSLVLVSKDLDIGDGLTEFICGIHKNTSCNSLLKTKASKVYGWVHWSDVGLVYFLGGLLIVIGDPIISGFRILAGISVISLAFVVYSIYYQGLVAKEWCPFCLGVQVLFIIEAILLANRLLPLHFSFASLIGIGTVYILTAFLVILFKAYFQQLRNFKSQRMTFLQFKRDPEIFRAALSQTKPITILSSAGNMILGDRDAPIQINAFMSLKCNPCRHAFNHLKALIFDHGVKVNIIFSLSISEQRLTNTLYNLCLEHNTNEAITLLDEWYNGSNTERKALLERCNIYNKTDSFDRIQKIHKQLFKDAGVTGTPKVFINGYGLPRQYAIADIQYFLSDLSTYQKSVI